MARTRPFSFTRRASWILAGVGLAWAAQSVLDPLHPSGSFWGPALTGAGLILELMRKRPWRGLVVACILSVVYGVSAHVPVEFRADSASYYVYLRSMFFDGDIDHTNEWEAWGHPVPLLTPTGLPGNNQSIGPAVVWSPFFCAAHLYVLADHVFGTGIYPANGYTAPYRRSTALGTLTLIVVGACLLARMMSRWHGWAIAVVAVVGTTLASPLPYYGFVVPAMAHGVTFGAAAVLLCLWDRTRRSPSLASWTLLGASLGLVTLCRWQAGVYSLLILLLVIQAWTSRSVRWFWLISGAAATAIVFVPQLLTWKILYDLWLTIPQGGRFLYWSSPNLTNALISANHGFFNWTPVMFFGFLGLILGLRKDFLLCFGGLLVFAATAWINGSVSGPHWAGDDAFGARRFMLVVPLIACGMGWFLELASRVFARVPLLAPTSLLAIMVLWNVGFMSQFVARKYPEMAPLERLAKDQARSLRLTVQEWLGKIGGDEGRALAYKFFSAEYFYTRFNRSGTINLWSADERYLLGGWSTRSRRIAKRTFRRALHPEACVRIPLEEPFELRVEISARAPEGMETQVMTVAVNDRVITSARLLNVWRNILFSIPESHLVPGENALCLRFKNALPGEEGRRVAAHVERIQLP